MSNQAADNHRPSQPPQAELAAVANGRATLRFSGGWRLETRLPAFEAMEQHLGVAAGVEALAFDSSGLTDWDSTAGAPQKLCSKPRK